MNLSFPGLLHTLARLHWSAGALLLGEPHAPSRFDPASRREGALRAARARPVRHPSLLLVAVVLRSAPR